MNVLIVFDLEGTGLGKVNFKKEMKLRGYHNNWIDANTKIKYHLPESSLWKKDAELKVAINDINSVIENLNKGNTSYNLKLTRLIAVPSTPWTGIEGDPHVENPLDPV